MHTAGDTSEKYKFRNYYDLPTVISDPSSNTTWQVMKSLHLGGAWMCFTLVVACIYHYTLQRVILSVLFDDYLSDELL